MLILSSLLCYTVSGLASDYDGITAVIDGKTADRVHLREGSSSTSKSLGLYFTGTEVLCQLDTVTDEWVWINVGMEAGYIKSEFLCFGTDVGSVVSKQPTGVVQNRSGSTWVNLRSYPALDGAVVCRLNNGDVVTVLGETVTKWYYIKVGDQFGYISADFLLVSNSNTNTGGTVTAVIDGKTADRVHLRERPSAESKSLGLYFTGTVVLSEPVTGKEWVRVSVGSEVGYMKSEYIYQGNNPSSITPQQPTGAVSITNVGSWVNMRADPRANASVVGRLYSGDVVIVLGETVTHWYYVKAGEQYSYIMSSYVQLGGVDQ